MKEGDVVRAKKYIRTVEVGARIGAALLSGLLLLLAVFIFLTSTKTAEAAKRVPPTRPVAVGQAPSVVLSDDTGLIGDYAFEDITNVLQGITARYNIQTALYASDEKAHDVYADFFDDEWGLVLYLEDHTDYATLHYYCGDELNAIFTEENIEFLDSKQTYLSSFSRDHATNAVNDFRSAMNTLFTDPSGQSYTAGFEKATAVFWGVMAVICWVFLPSVFCGILGLPLRKRQRAEIKSALDNAMEAAL